METVMTICPNPIPIIFFRIFQNFFGSISKPTRNNNIITPNSVACMISLESLPVSFKPKGPMIIPPNIKPITALSPSLRTSGTMTIAAPKNIKAVCADELSFMMFLKFL